MEFKELKENWYVKDIEKLPVGMTIEDEDIKSYSISVVIFSEIAKVTLLGWKDRENEDLINEFNCPMIDYDTAKFIADHLKK